MWVQYVARFVPGYLRLTADEQARLQRLAARFVREKSWEGCDGLVVTDELRAVIAAQACLPILALPFSLYDRVRTILMYPDDFETPARPAVEGIVGGDSEPASGETHYRGPVILSWGVICAGGDGVADGTSVVIHEFAHVLDDLDEAADGTPPLESREALDEWRRIMTNEFEILVRAAKSGEVTFLDPYGAESPAEFFAVASETFFTRPAELALQHTALYGQLRDWYRQDPAARPSPVHGSAGVTRKRGRTKPGPTSLGHAHRRAPSGTR